METGGVSSTCITPLSTRPDCRTASTKNLPFAHRRRQLYAHQMRPRRRRQAVFVFHPDMQNVQLGHQCDTADFENYIQGEALAGIPSTSVAASL